MRKIRKPRDAFARTRRHPTCPGRYLGRLGAVFLGAALAPAAARPRELLRCKLQHGAGADASLAEDRIKDLIQTIRLDLDCADVCVATGQIASRRSGTDELTVNRMIETCTEICRLCAEECKRHQDMEHCRIGAESCRSCERACREAAGTITPTLQ